MIGLIQNKDNTISLQQTVDLPDGLLTASVRFDHVTGCLTLDIPVTLTLKCGIIEPFTITIDCESTDSNLMIGDYRIGLSIGGADPEKWFSAKVYSQPLIIN